MIELKNVYKKYIMGETTVYALCDVSLRIEPGEFIAIMGPSGSGKSTLLHVLGFLDKPDEGSYLLGGRDVTRLNDEELAVLRNHLAGFVFQQFHLLSRATSLENVTLPLIYGGKKHLGARAGELLKEVGLSAKEGNLSNELSGGEQQRVAIARSLVNNPLIIFADEPTGNLDSKSEEEIISIIKRLHRTGKTIIMVTHEEELAKNAQRIIRMRDGKIISDEKITQTASPKASPVDISFDTLISASHLSLGKAHFFDHVKQALAAIISHKMRSLLSMLGILIGVGAVIAMLALGSGAQESIKQRLARLGSNMLSIRPGTRRMHGVALEAGAVTRFTLKDADAIAKLKRVVKFASPVVYGGGQFVRGNKNWSTRIYGANENYGIMRSYVPEFGRFFTRDDVRSRTRVVVIGATVARELFGEANPVGSMVKINRLNFNVIGVLPQKGASAWRDQDDMAIIPVTTAMYRLFGKDYINGIDVEIRDPSLMEEAQKEIGDLIRRRHARSAKNKNSFEIRNMAEIQEAVASTTKTMTWLLGSIAAISLLVGGIGIMNIMLVSVTERTREIGLRKAIGAGSRDILTQFLIESVVMSLSGGILGIIAGIGIAMLLGALAGWAINVTLSSIILATTFSVGVGIVFGLWPARKAAALNPIEALRYE